MIEHKNKQDRIKLYNQLLNQNGKKFQVVKAIEEMAELTKELTKYLNDDYSQRMILDELADVSIMIEQLENIFNDGSLVLLKDFKLNRVSLYTDFEDNLNSNYEELKNSMSKVIDDVYDDKRDELGLLEDSIYDDEDEEE